MSFDDSKSHLSSIINLPEICSYLIYGLFGHEELKQKAIERLNELKESDPIGFIYEAIQEIINQDQTDLIKTILTIEIEHTIHKPSYLTSFEYSDLLLTKTQLEKYRTNTTRNTNTPSNTCCWVNLDSNKRDDIKDLLMIQFEKLEDNKTRKHLANIIASIARIELQRKEWPELPCSIEELALKPHYIFIIQRILEKMQDVESNDWIMIYQLEIMFDEIINIVRNSYDSKLVSIGIKVIWSGLKIFKPILKNQEKFNQMLSLFIDRCASLSLKEQRAAIGCLSNLSYIYYEQMNEYIPELISTTTPLVGHFDEIVTMRALELWNNITLLEWKILDDNKSITPRSYIKQAYEELIPALLSNLQEVEANDLDTLKGMESKVFYESAMLLSSILDIINDDQTIISKFNFSEKIIEILPRFQDNGEGDSLQTQNANRLNTDDIGANELDNINDDYHDIYKEIEDEIQDKVNVTKIEDEEGFLDDDNNSNPGNQQFQ